MTMYRAYLGIVLAAFLAAVYCGCSDGVSHLDEATYDEVITLGVGESAYYVPGGLRVGFERTIGDSRCPANVLCIWAGEAHIRMWFMRADSDTLVATMVTAGYGQDSNTISELSVEVLCHRVSLLRLDPYPEDFGSIDPDEYVATIEVEPIGEGSCTQDIVITDLPPNSIRLHHYEVDTVAIWGNILTVGVRYGGGCEDHEFDLYMSPASFLESHPVQANLYLRHDDRGDRCEAIVSENRKFNLNRLADLYHRCYPDSYGRVQLNVYEYMRDDYSLSRSILYAF
jgi:hypothetical protein